MIVWDSQITNGIRPSKIANPKVFTIGDTIFAGAGDYPESRDAALWWREGCDPKRHPKGEWELIVWKKGDKPRLYSPPHNLTGFNVSLPCGLGSGGHTALTAHLSGLDPLEAIKIAYKLDIYSSGPTNSLDVKEFFKSVRRQPKA